MKISDFKVRTRLMCGFGVLLLIRDRHRRHRADALAADDIVNQTSRSSRLGDGAASRWRTACADARSVAELAPCSLLATRRHRARVRAKIDEIAATSSRPWKAARARQGTEPRPRAARRRCATRDARRTTRRADKVHAAGRGPEDARAGRRDLPQPKRAPLVEQVPRGAVRQAQDPAAGDVRAIRPQESARDLRQSRKHHLSRSSAARCCSASRSRSCLARSIVRPLRNAVAVAEAHQRRPARQCHRDWRARTKPASCSARSTTCRARCARATKRTPILAARSRPSAARRRSSSSTWTARCARSTTTSRASWVIQPRRSHGQAPQHVRGDRVRGQRRIPRVLGQAQARRVATSAATSASPRAAAKSGSRPRTTRSPTSTASRSRWSSTPATSPSRRSRNADFEGQLAAIGRSQAVIEFEHRRHDAQGQRQLRAVMGYSQREVRRQASQHVRRSGHQRPARSTARSGPSSIAAKPDAGQLQARGQGRARSVDAGFVQPDPRRQRQALQGGEVRHRRDRSRCRWRSSSSWP